MNRQEMREKGRNLYKEFRIEMIRMLYNCGEINPPIEVSRLVSFSPHKWQIQPNCVNSVKDGYLYYTDGTKELLDGLTANELYDIISQL